MPKLKTSKSPESNSSRYAKTMEELLAKKGFGVRGLTKGQNLEGVVIEVGSKSVVLDIGAKSEGMVHEKEFEEAREFIKTLSKGVKAEVTVVIPETENGHTLLSLRDAAEAFAWQIFESAFKDGSIVEVHVDSAGKSGLNVSFCGVLGFIPNSHLGGRLASNPQVAVGTTIKVKVVEVDRTRGKLVFSEKAVSESEAIAKQEKIMGRIKEGEKFPGKVTKLVPFGAFVQIEKDGMTLDGLVHLSELSWTKVSDPAKIVKVGDEVEIVVIGKEGNRLAFSIKKTKEDPWTHLSDKYKVDQKVKGRVTKIADVGAFVELEPGIEGLIRASRIPADISVKEEDLVSCFIEEIEKDKREISLGLVLKAKPVGYK